jgi:hypothetical protein
MKDQHSRLDELKSYQILDTPPEKELDELAKLASLICDVPISLITLIDKDRQWFKANKGLDMNETRREDSFCQHALHKPKEVFIVNDSLEHPLFKNNPLVKDNPNIRFYAGAPLETPNGNVLGTLCVIDNKPREISPNHQKALQILAKKAMDYMNTRKILLEQKDKIETNAAKLKKLTDNVPGGIFQLKMTPDGTMNFEFLSSGIKDIYPSIGLDQWKSSPEIIFSVIHPEDLQQFQEMLNNSIRNITRLYQEYRVESEDGFHWHLIDAQPERMPDESVVLYGSFRDITHHVEYETAMKQISFDISHVLRKPVTNLLGLTQLLESEKGIKKAELLEYIGYIKTVSLEIEKFTRDLNEVYQMKKEKITGRNNRHKK